MLSTELAQCPQDYAVMKQNSGGHAVVFQF